MLVHHEWHGLNKAEKAVLPARLRVVALETGHEYADHGASVRGIAPPAGTGTDRRGTRRGRRRGTRRAARQQEWSPLAPGSKNGVLSRCGPASPL
eukprot:310497-Prymnesium_polylepis.1